MSLKWDQIGTPRKWGIAGTAIIPGHARRTVGSIEPEFSEQSGTPIWKSAALLHGYRHARLAAQSARQEVNGDMIASYSQG